MRRFLGSREIVAAGSAPAGEPPPLPADLERLPDYLREAVPGFAESPELQAVAARRDRPKAAAGALGRYLLRLQRAVILREADVAEVAALERAYPVLEALASSEDPAVRELLDADVFGPFHSDDVVVAAAETLLGPRSRALYRRWAV
ncbi:MAG TPA: hypothetical protein VK915_07060 [Gaiellaceae bacterium]|nr:hypothetical protein [Gaiellaceae bacterium]